MLEIFHNLADMYSMSAAVKERPVRATQAKRGLIKEREKLFAKLQEINAAIPKTPLVLHGGSGVSSELLQRSIACGIRKVNFGTELKNAFTRTVKASLSSSDDIDLRRTFAPAIAAVEEISRSKIRICSSVAYERQTSNS